MTEEEVSATHVPWAPRVGFELGVRCSLFYGIHYYQGVKFGPPGPPRVGSNGTRWYDTHSAFNTDLIAQAAVGTSRAWFEDRPLSLDRVAGEELVSLVDAGGRVLAQDVVSRLPMPNCTLAKVDGMAVRSAEWKSASFNKPLRLIATHFPVAGAKWADNGFGLSSWLKQEGAEPPAGFAFSSTLHGPNPPVKGAPSRLAFPVRALQPLPYDADAVIRTMSPLFQGVTFNDKCKQRVIAAVPGGADAIARGEHMAPGELLLQRGQRLGGKELAMLASAGLNEVQVFKRPRVAILVVHQEMRPPDHEAPTAWLPDWFTPMVIQMLVGWGFTPEKASIYTFDQHSGPDDSPGRTIREFTESFDFTVVYRSGNLSAMHVNEWPITRKSVGGGGVFGAFREDANEVEYETADGAIQTSRSYTVYAGSVRSTEACGVRRTVDSKDPTPMQKKPLNCVASFEACVSPLSVLIGMHLLVKPALYAVSGVGDFPVLATKTQESIATNAELIPSVMPLPRCGFDDQWQPIVTVNGQQQVLELPPIPESVKRFAEGASKERWRRQNTRWFTGVLLNPAPRDPERHWLQLAQLESQDDGRMGVRVLPTEEYQVRHLNEAEAICMIDKASSPEETEFPPGTVVHYFLLD